MSERRYLRKVEDIRAIVGTETIERLEATGRQIWAGGAVVETPVVERDGQYFFDHVRGPQKGLRPIVCDEEGRLWIGKNYHFNVLVRNVMGAYVCGELGINSPEVRGAYFDKKIFCGRGEGEEDYGLRDALQLTEFVLGAEIHTEPIATEDRHKVIVPVLTVAGKPYRVPDGSKKYQKTDYIICTDLHRGNVFTDEEGAVYILDFGKAGQYIPKVADRLLDWGIELSLEHEMVTAQLKQIAGKSRWKVTREIRARVKEQNDPRLEERFKGAFRFFEREGVMRRELGKLVWSKRKIKKTLEMIAREQKNIKETIALHKRWRRKAQSE